MYSVRTAGHFARFTPDSDFFSPHILYSTHSTLCLFTFTLVVNPLLTTNVHHIFSSVLAEPQARYNETNVLQSTAGYHQTPLDPASRGLTAFRAAGGLYRWTRVAMGLKGAGPYFQRPRYTTTMY